MTVNSWLRGTVGIVGLEIKYHSLQVPEGSDEGELVAQDDVEAVAVAGHVELGVQGGDGSVQSLANMNVMELSELLQRLPENLINLSLEDILSRS